MDITPDCIELIKHYESLHDGDLHKIGLQAKKDCLGIWTIGYGHALFDKQGNPLRGDANQAIADKACEGMTEADAGKLLGEDLDKFSAQLKPIIHIFCSDAMFSSCVSLAYNTGLGAFTTSTVLREMNKGNKVVAANGFLLFNKGTVNNKRIVLPGLVKRRKAERAMFLGQDFRQFFV